MSVKYVHCKTSLQNLHPTWRIFVTVLQIRWCPTAITAAISLTVTHRFSLVSQMILPLFLLTESAHMQMIWGRLVMSVFPSLKCISHCLTLLAPMLKLPYVCRSHEWIWFRAFLLNKKFYHSMLLKHVLTSHFLALKHEHVTSTGDVIVLHYCLTFVYN